MWVVALTSLTSCGGIDDLGKGAYKVGVNATKKALDDATKKASDEKELGFNKPRVSRTPRCLNSLNRTTGKTKDCSEENLHGWDLADQDLTNVAFDNADLTDVDFSNSDLRGSTFIGANLSGANLFGAIVAGVDFTSTKLEGTTMPDGTIHK